MNNILLKLKHAVKVCLKWGSITLLCILLPVIAISRIFTRMIPKYRKRSFWTGQPIINMTMNAKAEQQLGFDSITIVRSTYFITNKFDFNISEKAGNNSYMALLLNYLMFIWVCFTADRVHAYVDGGLLPSTHRLCFNRFELFFYKVLQIKLFVWTYGADVRTRKDTIALGEPNCCTDCVLVGSGCICDDGEAKRNYLQVSKVAKAIFSMGDMIEYTPKSNNDLFFWPIDLDSEACERYRPVYPKIDKTRPLRVVHAPNHRHFKGTKYLEAAVSELIDEGLNIELILVEKIPNNEALAIYRSADLIFDQCLIGFHGYFALEAMALGKPVMCYIRYPDKYLLSPDECPIVNIHRDNLKEILRKFITTDRDLLEEIGYKSREYIEKNYSLEAFAARLNKCYDRLGVNN